MAKPLHARHRLKLLDLALPKRFRVLRVRTRFSDACENQLRNHHALICAWTGSGSLPPRHKPSILKGLRLAKTIWTL